MTIVVGIATPEGLVLAGDSRTTQTFGDNDRHRIASDNAQKLFAVEGMGIATFGQAFIGRDTIAGVMDQFAAHISGEEFSVETLAVALGEFFDSRFSEMLQAVGEEWDPANGFALGFLVAGYDEEGIGTIMEVLIPSGEIASFKATTTDGGMMWRGQTDVIGRLLKGIDWPCLDTLDVQLTQTQVEKLSNLEYVGLPPITLQDGIDYASFLVRTTIDMQRFSDGTQSSPGEIPGCGGPLQVLAIERSRHVWIKALTLHGPSQPGLAEGAAP
ncbi:MAG TPA: hypothetical protein VGW80_08075 [Solirubrobacterales bacterium]|nr:hypothetical protein [Solirubrobacterales bacterium]